MTAAASSLPSQPAQRRAMGSSQTSKSATVAAAREAIEFVMERRRKRQLYGRERAPRPPMASDVLERFIASASDVAEECGVPGRIWNRLVFLVPLGLAAFAMGLIIVRSGPACAVHPVAGQVRVGKIFPAAAQIVFHPVAAELPDHATPRATVREDGSFVVSTFRDGDGAPEGEYVATVQWFPISRDGSPGGNVLPKKYASPALSPLRVSIRAGMNELPAFQLTR